MGLEKAVNVDGQEQRIRSYPRVILLDGKYLEVRLIETDLWNGKGFSKPMPRARFIEPDSERFYYLVSKQDLEKLKKGEKIEKNSDNRRLSK